MLLVVAATALFGTIGTARVLGPDVSSWAVGAARVTLAATLLLAIAAATGAARDAVALRREPAAWLAGAGQAAFQVTFLAAVELTGVALGTLVAIGSAPVLTGLLSRRVDRVWAAATAVSVSGLALLVAAGQQVRIDPAGVALALGAGLSYAAYILGSSALAQRSVPPTPAVTAAFAMAAVLLAPALVLADLSPLASPGGLLLVGYLALLPTVVAYLLFNAALDRLPPATVSTLGLTEPVVAAVLGVGLLGERLSPAGVLGAVCVLAGLLLLARSAARPARPALV